MFCETDQPQFQARHGSRRGCRQSQNALHARFQRRCDPNFRLVRERIQSGVTGRLEQLVMHTRDPSPPPVEYVKRSGGMFRDQAIHDFDMARYLLGEEIRTVYAFGGCLIDRESARPATSTRR